MRIECLVISEVLVHWPSMKARGTRNPPCCRAFAQCIRKSTSIRFKNVALSNSPTAIQMKSAATKKAQGSKTILMNITRGSNMAA